MLSRVLEPELMDSPDVVREYNNMDHTAVNRGFVDDMAAAGFAGGDVLDMGTGTARIPIEIARRDWECRIMAADFSIPMLERARLNIEIAGWMGLIQLSYCDAKSTPYVSEMFDWVISNSLLHHLSDPQPALAEAWRVLRPGGQLFFRDLIRPESEDQCRQWVERYAADGNPAQRQMFENSLRAAFSLEEIRDRIVELGCPAESVIATSDRHWTWSTRK